MNIDGRSAFVGSRVLVIELEVDESMGDAGNEKEVAVEIETKGEMKCGADNMASHGDCRCALVGWGRWPAK